MILVTGGARYRVANLEALVGDTLKRYDYL